MRKLVTLFVLALSLQGVAQAAPAGSAEAALAWLSSIDQGAYAQSWATSATLFKSHISASDWAGHVKPTRAPLGDVTSRKQVSEKETTSLPGAPDGHYEVLTFDTDFTSKQGAIETIVLSAEPAGWKVDGYFIK